MSREQRTRNRLYEEVDFDGFTPYADEAIALAGVASVADLLDIDPMPSDEDDEPERSRILPPPFESHRGKPGYVYFPRDIEERSDLFVDGRYDPHANDVTDQTLQREVRVRGGSGGAKGAGRRKQRLPRPSAVAAILDEAEPSTAHLHIAGLTAGERHVLYEDRFRPGRYTLAQAILVQAVAYIRKHRSFPPVADLVRVRGAKERLQIYGLTELEIKLLRVRDGFSLRFLVEEAHRRHGEIIRSIDKDATRAVAIAAGESPDRAETPENQLLRAS